MKTYGVLRRLNKHGKLSRFYYCRVYCRVTRTDRWVSTHATSKRAAAEWKRTREYEAALGIDRRKAEESSQVTFRDTYVAWLTSRQGTVSREHFRTQESRGNRFWLPYFGSFVLREITADHVRSYLRRRIKGTVPRANRLRPISVSTLNSDLAALKAIFNFAISEGWLDRSPAQTVKPYSGTMKRRVRTLSLADEDRLLEACRQVSTITVVARRNAGGRNGGKTTDERTFRQRIPVPDYLYPAVLTAVRCGFRRGTLFSIRWREIDFDERLWRIPGEFMKSARDYIAPVPPEIITELQRYRTRLARQKGATQRLAKDSRIFGLAPEASIRKAFQAAVSRAGIERLTFHDLRRIYLNRLRESGVPIDVAMELTGHRSLETVLKHYREVPISDCREALARVSRLRDSGGLRVGETSTTDRA